jgi:hypothetical protein
MVRRRKLGDDWLKAQVVWIRGRVRSRCTRYQLFDGSGPEQNCQHNCQNNAYPCDVWLGCLPFQNAFMKVHQRSANVAGHLESYLKAISKNARKTARIMRFLNFKTI